MHSACSNGSFQVSVDNTGDTSGSGSGKYCSRFYRSHTIPGSGVPTSEYIISPELEVENRVVASVVKAGLNIPLDSQIEFSTGIDVAHKRINSITQAITRAMNRNDDNLLMATGRQSAEERQSGRVRTRKLQN
jgi:hypothetical protein